jgi:multiple sugar transport system substrate-binding protein
MISRQSYHIVIYLCATLIFASGCANQSQQYSDGKIRVHYWYVSGATDQIPLSVSLFNNSQDSIEVIPVPIPWKEHEKKVLTAILSGNPPDVINLVTPIVKWSTRLALLPLDEYMTVSGMSADLFYPANWDDVTWLDRPYGLPMHTASYAFFYNKTHFREAGLNPESPPQTWDELRQIAYKLDRRDARNRLVRMGFMPEYGNLQTPLLMAWQDEVEFLKGDTLINLSDPALIKAMDWIEKYYEPYTLNEILGLKAGFGFADQHGFISEKVSMMVLDNTFLDQIDRYNPTLDFGVVNIPKWQDSKSVSSTGTWWVAIPRGAKNADAAWVFMKFATSVESQLYEAMNMSENLFPANRLALTDSVFLNAHPTHQVFTDMLAVAVSPSVVPMAHDLFWREYSSARESVFYGRSSPERALINAQLRIQRALNEAIDYDRYVRANTISETIP